MNGMAGKAYGYWLAGHALPGGPVHADRGGAWLEGACPCGFWRGLYLSFAGFRSGDWDAEAAAGGCPAASHFLLLAQKKVTKEKGTRVRRFALRANFPALLDLSGGCATRLLRSLRQCSPTSPDRSALLGGSHGMKIVAASCACRLAISRCARSVLTCLPSVASSSAGWPGGSRRALSEPRAARRVAQPPRAGEQRRAPVAQRRAQQQGRFLLVTFLGDARKVTRLPGETGAARPIPLPSDESE